jgi:regulator of nucleoside diphosphate kinase
MSKSTGIFLTEPDAARLERSIIAVLLRSPTGAPDAIELEAILDEAEVVPSTAIDRHLVTMNSVVVLEDLRSSHRTTVTLAYPGEADPACLRISVLSSLGRALIGARVGDVINASFADSASRAFVVAELVYQPEAAGRYDL